MPLPRFKQRCALCKKNMVVMYSGKQFPICVECHMRKINVPIEDPKYKKILDIPQDLYEKSLFLRNIKESFTRFGSLTENQINAFLKAVEDVKKPKVEVPLEPIEITNDIWSRKRRVKKKIETKK